MISLSGLGIRVKLAAWNELGSVPSYTIFLKYFCRTGIHSSFIYVCIPKDYLKSAVYLAIHDVDCSGSNFPEKIHVCYFRTFFLNNIASDIYYVLKVLF